MVNRSRGAFLVLTSVLGACALAPCAAAQVRMNLRATMQIDPLTSWLAPGSMDERFWPVEATGFAPGDVDGDGDLDLLMAENHGHSRVWFNDGSGGLTRFVQLPSGRSGCCALFDADGDGDLDALLAGGSTTYASGSMSALYRNDGTGAFTQSATIPASFPHDMLLTHALGIGDLDGDGDRDVVLFALGTHPRCWRNDGTGVFTDHSATAWPGAAGGGSSIRGTLADVEPDGDLDVITTDPDVMYRNNGLGAFTIEPPIPWPIPTRERVAVDVDGDTLVDEVGVANDVPFVRRNIGGGVLVNVSSTWFEPHALVDRTPDWAVHACASFDADGDGDPDLVTGGSEQRSMSSTTVGVPPKLFLNSNGQRFVEGGRPALPMLNDTITALTAGDVDGDGDADLVLAYAGTYTTPSQPMRVWHQDAAGRFVEGAVPFTQSLSALALADVDGDSDLDLFGIGGWGPLFPGVPLPHRLALNDGSGNFTDVTATHMPASAVAGGASCAAGDVDGDGDVDLVIGSYFPNWGGPGVPLMLLANNGSGVFTNASAQLPSTPYESSHVVLRDFDADGDRDIVVAANPSHPITPPILFFANNGAGTFTDATAASMPATGPATGLHVLDLDGDGDLDIAQSSVDLWNNGAGVFTATPATSSPRLLVADFDQDTVPDALIHGPYVGDISVAGGRIVFQDRGAVEHGLLPVDLDRDDDLDLVVGPLHAFSNPAWAMLRIELVYNLRRDLRVATLPRIGTDYRLQLRATNGTAATFAIVAFATATLPQPIEIPGWGALRLDPTQMAVLGTALIPDADTMAEVTMPIPGTPSLFGLPLSCQALFVPVGNEAATHLSNAMTFPLER